MEKVPNPKLFYALILKCPYCGKTPLRLPGSWFTFRDRCIICSYNITREPGYWSGASQLIIFSLISVVSFIAAGLLLWKFQELAPAIIAGSVSIGAILFGSVIYPFGMAFWLYIDHKIHPIHVQNTKK